MPEARTLDETLPVHGRGQVGTPWWGLIALIATEGCLFIYLIFSYAYLGSQGSNGWPPGGTPSLALALPATILLLGSSFVLEWGKRAANRGQRGRNLIGVATTIVMGTAFAALELYEWSRKGFGIAADSYSSIYYTITGIHLLHVAVGLFALVILLYWTLTGQVRGQHIQHRALTTLYWHFVDAVWLFVFLTIYVSPRLT